MKGFLVFILLLSLAVPLAGAKKNWSAVETKVYPMLDMRNAKISSQVVPPGPVITASPGIKVGNSWYDEQHNGSISKMIVLDPDTTGCVHFFWMRGFDPASATRHVYYNFGDPPLDSIGVQIDPGSVARAGYITGDILSTGKAVAAYHARLSAWAGADIASAMGIDLISCLGAFDQNWPDTISLGHGALAPIWPHVAVDDMDNIHVVANQPGAAAGDPTPMYYSRSTDQGVSYSTWTLIEDSLFTISYDVQTSRSSGKVAISYCKTLPWDPGQVQEDIVYFESTDYGATWDFNNPINVTNFTPSDTFRAYADVSTIYDENDSLHLAFPLRSVQGDTLFFFASAIMHWSKETGMTVINSDTLIGWHSQYDAGGFRMMADRPSLGIDPSTGNLYCIFVGNLLGDTSAAAWPNAEIFATCSEDGGLNWGPAVNLTNTPTPGCTPGNCEDDDWPSLAEIVYDNLHIIYINDKDAGGDAGGQRGEGAPTLNPILYYKYPKANIPCVVVGTEEENEKVLPTSFTLSQNVPNPFGRGTTISYTLPVKSSVDLSVYDITGREVASLLEGEMDAGYHTLSWDGKDNSGNSVSAGVYFYRLQASDVTKTRKLVVLR
jgi:hypothetical protein